MEYEYICEIYSKGSRFYKSFTKYHTNTKVIYFIYIIIYNLSLGQVK